MADANQHVELLTRAIDQVAGTISPLRRDQASMPTPCASFDLRALVNHIVHDVETFTARALDQAPSVDKTADVIGDDWSAAYRRATQGLLAAWQTEGALERTTKAPWGEVPATWHVDQHITDLAVHAWDVARATGQSTDLDPEVGQLALDWGKQNLGAQFRGDEQSGKAFGPEVAVANDAPLYDRLAAWFGRQPS